CVDHSIALSCMSPRPPCATPFPYTALCRSPGRHPTLRCRGIPSLDPHRMNSACWRKRPFCGRQVTLSHTATPRQIQPARCIASRSEEHTSELQSRFDLVCRLLLEKRKGHAK